MDIEKQQAAPISQLEQEGISKFLTSCTLVVNSHGLARRIREGRLEQGEFTDLCKLFELQGYDLTTTQFTVKVDTHMRDAAMISQVPPFANRHTRRLAAKMERKDARKR